VLLLYVYVPLVLSFFPWTTPLSRRIVAYALPPFAAAWAASVAYLPNLFYLAAGVIIARYALKFVRSVFAAMGSGAIRVEGFHRDWADPTYKIARVMVLAFAVMALYPFLPGAGSDAFKGVSIFLGVFFSLGSSAAIGNVVAGVVLTYTNAFRTGDRVKIGDTVGDVVEKTLLVTRLCTIKNIAVTIPNGAVLGSQIVNYSTHASAQGLIQHTAVTIGYDAPWRQVHALLIDAARATEDICEVPPPFVLQTSLADFYGRTRSTPTPTAPTAWRARTAACTRISRTGSMRPAWRSCPRTTPPCVTATRSRFRLRNARRTIAFPGIA
jgi:small-conductance mechanosensitive channel